MKENKSKFAAPSTNEETKEGNAQVQDIPKLDLKKGHDPLQVKITKASEIRKWQEIKFTSKLPERRSFACSCVYKGRY